MINHEYNFFFQVLDQHVLRTPIVLMCVQWWMVSLYAGVARRSSWWTGVVVLYRPRVLNVRIPPIRCSCVLTASVVFKNISFVTAIKTAMTGLTKKKTSVVSILFSFAKYIFLRLFCSFLYILFIIFFLEFPIFSCISFISFFVSCAIYFSISRYLTFWRILGQFCNWKSF